MPQLDALGVALALAAGLALAWLAVLAAFSGPLVARWREPVFRVPILVIESDDWGAGPDTQAELLAAIAATLARIRDTTGQPALMTLGMVFEMPDGARIAREGFTTYHGLTLDDTRFTALRETIAAGIRAGVFVPQLHGQCHYWPPALMAAAAREGRVRAWLAAGGRSEDLPSPLQSRWVDAWALPSRPLAAADIDAAARREAASFAQCFGHPPRVAVPTTFVWNAAVEAAWQRAGVAVVVTPGRRATCRAAAGQPGCVDRRILTGERSDAGQTYLVRDVYFEPARGHTPERLVEGLALRTRQGRACLVETHRVNFLDQPDASLVALEAGLAACRARFPTLRFLAPEAIAHAIATHDPALIERRWLPRLVAWRARLHEIPLWTRIARLSGLAVPLKLIGLAA